MDTTEWSPSLLLIGDMEHPKHSGRYVGAVDEESYAEALAEIARLRGIIRAQHTCLVSCGDETADYDASAHFGTDNNGT